MINYKKELNKKQFEAVSIVNGPAVIVAGAGTGKTTLLVYRVARLIEMGVNPENILLITFTNKAAKEMKERVISKLGSDGTKITAQTFHSFAANTLRVYGSRVGLDNNFTIIDGDDAKGLFDDLKEKYQITKNDLPNSTCFTSILTYMRNCNKTLDQAISMFADSFKSEKNRIQAIINDYDNYKLSHSYLDYDDLLIWTNKLMIADKNVAKTLANKYQYVMIDEYQDSNAIQLSMIKEMVKGIHNNVVVVGDDQQSIYAWRGSNFLNIINFNKDFPGAKLVILEENYRSQQGILNLANAIIESAKEKYPKKLYTLNTQNQMPQVIRCYDDREEADDVILRIKRLISFGNNYSDIAILSRTSQVQALEFSLLKNNIPYQKYGGLKFFAKAHMKDLISYLRILANEKDELALKRILRMHEGVGKKTCEKIIDEVRVQGLDALLNYKKRKFGETLCDLHQFLTSVKTASPEKILEGLLEERYVNNQRLDGYYISYLTKTYPKDYDKRLEECNELFTMSYEYDNLSDFLEDIILEASNQKEADGCVTLSTIHSAKGLEFKYVFIVDCTDDNFPSYRSKTEEEIEEERRLLYVAVTRAKKDLCIYIPRCKNMFNRYQSCEPSRFLMENNIINKYLD